MELKTLLKILPIIHFTMFFSLVAFAGFVYWKNQDFIAVMNKGDSFIYIVPIVAAVGYFASKSVFQQLMNMLEKENDLQAKLKRYRLATIIKYALLEVPTIMALIAYFIRGNALYLVVALSLIVYLFSQRPTRKKVLEDLKLTLKEQKEINSKN